MRKPVIVLGGVLLLAIALDFALKSAAENRIGSELQSHFELESKPGVSLKAWPFLLSVARGRIRAVSLEAGPIERDGVRLDAARVVLRGLRFSASEILSGDIGSVRSRSGGGFASLGEATINEALARQDVALRVRLEGELVLVEHPLLPEPVRGEAAVEGNQLILRGPPPLEPVAITLPEVGTGILFRDVAIEDSAAVLSLELTERALRFGD